jgi:hypothetical protein
MREERRECNRLQSQRDQGEQSSRLESGKKQKWTRIEVGVCLDVHVLYVVVVLLLSRDTGARIYFLLLFFTTPA